MRSLSLCHTIPSTHSMRNFSICRNHTKHSLHTAQSLSLPQPYQGLTPHCAVSLSATTVPSTHSTLCSLSICHNHTKHSLHTTHSLPQPYQALAPSYATSLCNNHTKHSFHTVQSLSLPQPNQALTPSYAVSLCHNHTKHSLYPSQSLSVTTIPNIFQLQSLHQVFSCSCLLSANLKLPFQSGHLFLLFLQKMHNLFMICLQVCQLLLQITIFCNK